MPDTKPITRLLARKNGDIAIVEVTSGNISYLVLKYIHERTKTKVFLAERGRVWELFCDVNEAIAWIKKDVNDERQ